VVKSKIICTLGPASATTAVIRAMMRAGMDVARLNFSHATHAMHQASVDTIRILNEKYRRHIRILQDLEGYRIRVGRLAGKKPLALKKGQKVFLTNRDVIGEKNVVPFDYEGPLRDIKIGNYVYIDDGNIALLVVSRSQRSLVAKVVVGGLIKEYKGINLPGVTLHFQGITEKDTRDLHFGIKNNVDYIAQSFVRTKRDILHIRDFIRAHHFDTKLIAKIENKEGIKNIDEIIDVSDGIMIARGDMGVSLPLYEIPIMQKIIIKKCNRKKKMVITATQMLESMTENIRPTRAEVTDVANAILDGSGYVMLSGESAAGKYPVDSVRTMNDIIKFTEQSLRARAVSVNNQ